MKRLIVLLFCSSACFAQSGYELRRELFGSSSSGLEISGATQNVIPESPGKKNAGLAVLYSLLLPGMGELYAGNYSSGKYFTVAEGVLWLGLGGLDRYATSLQDDARAYAAQHAGVASEGRSDQYYIDIGDFSDVYQYNEQALRSRDPEKLYDPSSSDYWRWDSDQNREMYRDRRVSADQMFNNTRFVVAAIAVNHVVSAINAARAVITHNRGLASFDSYQIHADVLGGIANPQGIVLSLTKTF